MDVSKFTRDEVMLVGVALLLVIDLLFLPWFDISVAIGTFKVSATSSATGSPDAWLGVLAVLVTLAMLAMLAMLAYMVVERLGDVELPTLGGSPATTRVALAALAAGFVALKFLFNIHFSLFGVGFWGAVVLSAALVVLAARARDTEEVTATLPGHAH
jgi:hypothetical protein